MKMNRETNARFELAPQVGIERSTFRMDTNVKTSFNVGDCIPFFCMEVLPGDTFDINTAKVMRLQTLLTPVMDNLYLDVYYFFVPNRLVWKHWQNFCGENTDTYWTPSVEYTVPKVTAPSGGWNVGTIADYLGIPTGVSNIKVNALPFRAYALIMNQWFRDENLTTPLYIDDGDTNRTGSNSSGTNYVYLGGQPFKAAKFHDYFTSALPEPQRGPDVTIPLGTAAPVITGTEMGTSTMTTTPIKWRTTSKTYPDTQSFIGINGANGTGAYGYTQNDETFSPTANVLPTNLYANLENATAATINQLRLAISIQRAYEIDARSGTRYIEILRSHFGVVSPDARLQRAEYLGGNRFPLNIEQVTQTSSTDSVSPIGTVAGWSQTADYSSDVFKSFVEHGFIIGICVARYDHTYQQGLECMWSRSTRFDYYWPVFAHIGEKAVYNKELYAQGTSADDEVFGYQEAWAEYRYKPNYVTGQMRSQYAQSLDIWHFADDYSSQPYLSDSWIREDATNIDRTLAVPSTTANQIFGDILVEVKATRPMPLYSIPGIGTHL